MNRYSVKSGILEANLELAIRTAKNILAAGRRGAVNDFNAAWWEGEIAAIEKNLAGIEATTDRYISEDLVLMAREYPRNETLAGATLSGLPAGEDE